MKRILLSFMALVALVLVANTALAQDKWTPVVGVSYDYSVSGITNESTYQFLVNTSTTTLGTHSSSIAAITSNDAGTTVSGTTLTATIKWNLSDGPYSLWISATGTATDICYNYRYVTVEPQANTLSATILAYGSSTSTLSEEACPDLTGNVFYNPTATDGATDLYFLITLVQSNDPSGTWTPGLSITNEGTTTYSFDGVNFGTPSLTGLSTASSTIWVKTNKTNTTTAATLVASIAPVETLAGGQTVTPTTDPADATLLLKGLPFVGTINFN